MATTMNFWPILVASIVAFGISALWFSPILFGKDWMDLMRLSDADVAEARARGVWKQYLVQFLMLIVAFAVLAFFAAVTGSTTAGDGAFLAFLAWVGFYLTAGVGELLWRRAPAKLVVINEVCSLVVLLVGGAIIGAWR